jgi:hypothetical protein
MNTFLVRSLFKEYFFEFNNYMRPGPFIESFYDNFSRFDIFRDLGYIIRYQWVPFSLMVFDSKKIFRRALLIKYSHTIVKRYLGLKCPYLITALLTKLLRDEQYKVYLRMDTVIFIGKY